MIMNAVNTIRLIKCMMFCYSFVVAFVLKCNIFMYGWTGTKMP